MSLLEIRDLSIEFPSGENTVKAVSDVSFDVREGEVFGIIGESGSGKSVIGLALLRLLPANATVSGTAFFQGQDLFPLNPQSSGKSGENGSRLCPRIRLAPLTLS
ncbi:ATP-binding cassette domain-containing protein [Methanosarcina horonobensis]|uniref:ATP-binding cassette domain-containing protein n=1 Tax=Methanosarcina horonobensis TaxID=418008 RepID=UPI000AF7878E|nr:ATP-binding cassette domain-containing protein [Methanosarcina horonobensis]